MKIRSERGSLLLGVLVFIAIASASLYMLMSLLSSSANMVGNTKSRYALIDFMAGLRTNLSDPYTCPIMLKGVKIPIPALITSGFIPTTGLLNPPLLKRSSTAPFTINLIDGQGASPTMGIGWTDYLQNFTITDIDIVTVETELWVPNIASAATPLQRKIHYDEPIAPNTLYSFHIRLSLDAKNANPNLSLLYNNSEAVATTGSLFNHDSSLFQHSSAYTIDLIANVDPTGLIYQCHGMQSVASVCEDSGGAYYAFSPPTYSALPLSWEAVTNPAQYRCEPNYRCWPDISGIHNTPAPPAPAAPVPYTGCLAPYNHVSWIGRTGGQDKWVCSWCNTH